MYAIGYCIRSVVFVLLLSCVPIICTIKNITILRIDINLDGFIVIRLYSQYLILNEKYAKHVILYT